MIDSEILKPVIALLAWTLVMWLWMYATRIPAMIRDPGIEPGKMVGTTGASLRAQLPERVSWKADNYNHLHEAPTLFYAVALTLAMIGQGVGFNVWLAWMYVFLRILHSLVQATVNVVPVRFALFLLSQLALGGLILHAAMTVFGWR